LAVAANERLNWGDRPLDWQHGVSQAATGEAVEKFLKAEGDPLLVTNLLLKTHWWLCWLGYYAVLLDG
jgi:hypothetical protein